MMHEEPSGPGHSGRHRKPKNTHARLGVMLAIPAGAAIAGIAAAAPASADVLPVNGTGTLVSELAGGGLCLEDSGGQAVDYNPVLIDNCNQSDAQQWTFTEAGSTIQDYGMCLDVWAGGNWDGDTVDLYQCNDTGAQVWIPQTDGSLFNPQSGKCLDDTAFGGAGTQLEIWDCNGGMNQEWLYPGYFYAAQDPAIAARDEVTAGTAPMTPRESIAGTAPASQAAGEPALHGYWDTFPAVG